MAPEIVPGVRRIRCTGVNAYIVETDEGPVLVDAGTGRDAGALEAAVRGAGYAPETLRAVLLTHNDPDHVGGLAGLLGSRDVPVHMHRLDAAAFAGDDPLPVTRWKGLLQRVGGLLTPEADVPVRELKDGDEVAGLEVVHTPGHTPGHVSFVDRDRGLVLAGDLVWAPLGRIRLMPGIMDDDPDLSAASLGSLVHRVADVEAVLPGHGRPVTDDAREALRRAADL